MSMIGQEKEATSDSLSAPCDDVKQLRLRHIIGFNGHVPKGLIIHPKEKHMLYPVASDIVIEHITKTADGEQEFLSRHSDTITALDVSPDGRFVASGQKICAGSKAPVILWDFCLRQLLMEWPAHNVKVQAISFLKSSHIFVSLGVDEDGHLTVWGVGQRQPLTNQLAQPQRATAPRCLAASKRNGDKFITAGRGHGRLWTLSSEGRELAFTELRFGPLGRDVTCVEVADYDSTEHQMAFLGNTGGDILVVNMTNGTMQACVPKKPVPSGITSITYLRMLDASTFNLLVGTGNGKVMNYDVALTYEKGNKVKGTARLAKDTNVWSDEREQRAVTSIAKLGVGNTFYVGTESCQMYVFNLYRWSAQLIRTCCLSPVLTLTFARGTDDLLVTGEFSQVRVFNLHVNAEVRRYFRANRTCTSAVVNHDGTQVFTGWDNGGTVVLGFDPKDLALKDLYRIDSTQKQAVTALALTSESSVLVSGGKDGQTKIWRLVDDLDRRGQRVRQGLLLHQFTYQTGPISTVQISTDDQKCACASQDGSLLVYGLSSGRVLREIRVSCPLHAARFCCQDLQVLACGGDGVVRQWELLTGDMLREDLASKVGSAKTVCVSKGNKYFVTAGDDTLVKLWSMETGEVTHMGKAHCESVICSVFGPCGSVLVSSGLDGSICVWDVPSDR